MRPRYAFSNRDLWGALAAAAFVSPPFHRFSCARVLRPIRARRNDMGSTGRARVAGALLVMVAAAGAGQAMAQPIPPDDGQAAGTNAPPPPPDDGWDPG